MIKEGNMDLIFVMRTTGQFDTANHEPCPNCLGFLKTDLWYHQKFLFDKRVYKEIILWPDNVCCKLENMITNDVVKTSLSSTVNDSVFAGAKTIHWLKNFRTPVLEKR